MPAIALFPVPPEVERFRYDLFPSAAFARLSLVVLRWTVPAWGHPAVPERRLI
jgi:hypothetical protein